MIFYVRRFKITVCLSRCLPSCPNTCVSVCPSIYLPVYQSACLLIFPVHLSCLPCPVCSLVRPSICFCKNNSQEEVTIIIFLIVIIRPINAGSTNSVFSIASSRHFYVDCFFVDSILIENILSKKQFINRIFQSGLSGIITQVSYTAYR